jgi:hemerythrin-like domain-containing protein
MPAPAHPTVGQLHRDHANLARLLMLIEHQVQAVDNGRRADVALLRGVMDYWRGYPQRFHHPRENAIFNLLKDRATDGIRDVQALIAAHDRLNERIDTVEAALGALEHLEKGAETRFVLAAREFIAFERTHMVDEETKLFPLAARVLKPEDWTWVEEAFVDPGDPLFGDTATEPYRRVLRALIAHDQTHGLRA